MTNFSWFYKIINCKKTGEWKMPRKKYKSELLRITIEIDQDNCTGCGNCVVECPSEVFELINERSACIIIDDCVECCACVDACPENVIKHSSCLE